MISSGLFLDAIPYTDTETLKKALEKISTELRNRKKYSAEISEQTRFLSNRIQQGITPNYIPKLIKGR